MILSLIVAVSQNNVIGKSGKLPWSLPDDLHRFRSLTRGHPVIMGRGTYDCLPPIFRPLPGRLNIVLTHRDVVGFPGCTVVRSMEEAIAVAEGTGAEESFVIGGGVLYALAMPFVQRIYLTRVHVHIEGGDTFFPTLSSHEWREMRSREHDADGRHSSPFTFVEYEKMA